MRSQHARFRVLRAAPRRALALAAFLVALSAGGGCSRYLGRDHVVKEEDVDRAASLGKPVGAATVRVRGFSFYPGGGWAFRIERVQPRAMPEPIEMRVDRIERTAKWHPFFDGCLAKVWFDIPVGLITSPWTAIRYRDAHGLCENVVFDLAARLAGGSGRDGARYRRRYYGEERPGYFARLLHWTSWFNPFQAFGSWDYDVEAVSVEELSVVMARVEAREPLPCDAVTLVGPGGAQAARPLGAGWWCLDLEHWLGIAAPGSPVLVIAYPGDLPGKAYTGEIFVHAPIRPPEDEPFPMRLGDAALPSPITPAAIAAEASRQEGEPAPLAGPALYSDEFQALEAAP